MLVSKFFRIGIAALSAFLIAKAAQAADLYNGGYYGGYKDQPPAAAPAPFWQGLYAGGHVGGVWSSVDAASNVVFVQPNLTLSSDRSASTPGWFGGVQAGYNLQNSSFLWGIEADLGGIDNRGSHSFIIPNPARTMTVASAGGWYGDITNPVR